MTKYTITPIRTTMKRGWQYLRGKSEDYLENLTSFSKYARTSIRSNLGKKTLTTEEIRGNGYSDIAIILGQKNIKSIKFEVDYCREDRLTNKTDRIMAASIRAVFRHLATYGIQKNTQNGYIDYHLGEDNWLRSDFTIEASEGSSLIVSLDIGKLKPPHN